MNNMINKPAPAAMELLCGCRGLSMNIQMAGLYRDCYGIAGARTRRSVSRPGGFSDFSNIIRMIPKEQKGDR